MIPKRILTEYHKARDIPSDISDHIPTLYGLSRECGSVVEAGVRYVVSSWAFILGCACYGGKVESYCWNMLPEIKRAIGICLEEGVLWNFSTGDWLLQEIPETDLLFIDTNHFYSQLQKELQKHGNKARKYIVLHDTVSYGEVGADGKRPGLQQAIDEFVSQGVWYIAAEHKHCNGLTVLKRR